MHAAGEYTITDLTEVFNVSRPTVYRTHPAAYLVSAQQPSFAISWPWE